MCQGSLSLKGPKLFKNTIGSLQNWTVVRQCPLSVIVYSNRTMQMTDCSVVVFVVLLYSSSLESSTVLVQLLARGQQMTICCFLPASFNGFKHSAVQSCAVPEETVSSGKKQLTALKFAVCVQVCHLEHGLNKALVCKLSTFSILGLGLWCHLKIG